MMVFISKVNNYMFRPKAAIFSYHDYNFVQRVSYIYIYIYIYMCVCVCVCVCLYCILMLRSHHRFTCYK